MDSLRGNYYDADHDPQPLDNADDSDAHDEVPPSPVGQDERRMQVRAYNFWASLLDNRSFPSIEDLDPENLPDFGPNSVLLDFSTGIDDPAIPFLGDLLVDECNAEADTTITKLSDVPSRSLLSRITDHYMQILANQAPIGFEAEFVNQAGNTVLYRGILLPFSSDDETIDFIYGVINWKELADQDTTDALMLEVDQSLERAIAEAEEAEDDDEALLDSFAIAPERSESGLADYAEGPLGEDSAGEDAAYSVDYSDGYDDDEDVDASANYGSIANLPPLTAADLEEAAAQNEPLELPEPAFGLQRTVDQIKPPIQQDAPAPLVDAAEEEPFDLGDFVTDDDHVDEAAPMPEAFEPSANDIVAEGPETAELGQAQEAEAEIEDTAEHLPVPPESATHEPSEADEIDDDVAATEIEAEDMGLADWLASARELAQRAQGSEERTRSALYEAIGRAYDFSLAAEESPEDFVELVEEAGLSVQERAPMTPIVKLVFGADYDKTRVTEYAAALSHGHRVGVSRGEMSRFLSGAKGGLKGVVKEERRLRRAEQGKPVEDDESGIRAALAKKLRKLDPQEIESVEAEGAEFGLLMIRREPDGSISLLGEVPEDTALVERAARKLLG